MNSKSILVDSYPALFEYSLLNGAEMTNNLSHSTYIVNPFVDLIYNKTIIINLPVEVPLECLLKYNRIISRFPINYEGIEVRPYELPDNRKELHVEDYSLILLNKDLVNDIDYAEIVNNGNFLIGIDECIDGAPTLIGQLILRSKIEDIK